MDIKNCSKENIEDILTTITNTKIENCKASEIISDLIREQEESSKLMNSQVSEMITTDEEPLLETIKATCSIVLVCEKEYNIVVDAISLHKKIDKYIKKTNKEWVIILEEFNFFRVLHNYFENENEENFHKIADILGITGESKTDTTKEFIYAIQNVDANEQRPKDIISALLNLAKTSSKLMSNKIIDLFIKHPAPSLKLALHLIVDKELNSIHTSLSEADNDVGTKVSKLKFFNTEQDGWGWSTFFKLSLIGFGTVSKDSAEDFLVNSMLYQKYLKTITKFVLLRQCGLKVINKVTINDHNEISITSTLTKGLKRTELVVSLGNYGRVAVDILNVQNKLNLSEAELVDSFKQILRGKNLYKKYPKQEDNIKMLYDITYLLFSCEVNRNPEALISNAIFLELVKSGIYKISAMPEVLPMAMVDAIQIGRFYHKDAKVKRVNDYGAVAKKAPPNINEFKVREAILLQKWLNPTTEPISIENLNTVKTSKNLEEVQKIDNSCITHLTIQKEHINRLKKLIHEWYGIDISITLEQGVDDKLIEFGSNFTTSTGIAATEDVLSSRTLLGEMTGVTDECQ